MQTVHAEVQEAAVAQNYMQLGLLQIQVLGCFPQCLHTCLVTNRVGRDAAAAKQPELPATLLGAGQQGTAFISLQDQV